MRFAMTWEAIPEVMAPNSSLVYGLPRRGSDKMYIIFSETDISPVTRKLPHIQEKGICGFCQCALLIWSAEIESKDYIPAVFGQ